MNDISWFQIIGAILMAGFLILIWPAAKEWVKNSPEGSTSDWLSALIPLVLVGVFVALLIAAV
ncbi:MAG: hypothetical protein GKR94_13015 [Gammaproteobacteria bacterium]|nr:hypothetical protein [Gammaproteobacteria bacterium]